MTNVRRLLLDHRALSAWLVACALLMKLLVPAGFMPVWSAAGLTIQICSGVAPQKMVMAMPGMHHQDHSEHQDKPEHQGKEMPCAFTGLSASSLAAADPVVLALAILFVFATALRGVAPPDLRAPTYLRPPLRGPPFFS